MFISHTALILPPSTPLSQTFLGLGAVGMGGRGLEIGEREE